MKFEERRIEAKSMKPYKGYGIDKSWEVIGNKKVPGSDRYMVIDEEDDWIGDVYTTLAGAKEYIDSLVAKEVKASTKLIKADTTIRAWSTFSKWYDSLRSSQRDLVDDIADQEGLPLYEECSDDQLAWLIDEAEIVFKESEKADLNGPIPKEIVDYTCLVQATATNSTYNDDLLRIAEEEFDGIKVRFDYVKNGKLRGTGWNIAFVSANDANAFIDDITGSIPLVGRPSIIMTIDWNKAYNIQIDDYYEGIKTINWHNVGNKVPQN